MSARVPVFMRQAVRRCVRWWREWRPELVGEPPRAERVVEPLEAARERVSYCEAMLREHGEDGSVAEQWRQALKGARMRVAELGGEPYRELGGGRIVRHWRGLTGKDA